MSVGELLSEIYNDRHFPHIMLATVLLLPFYFAFQAMWAKTSAHMSQYVIEKKRILYVIAHPDDEAM